MSCLFYVIMLSMNKLALKKNTCSYCGESPINHYFAFLESAIFFNLDNHVKKFIKYVPSFVKDFVDLVPEFLFKTLVFVKIAKFSNDIDKANTFRSRIIWEEAKKRDILMEQVIFLGKPLDQYRALLKIRNKSKYYYFESIPIRPEFLDKHISWDDKVVMKQEFKKYKIPVPDYVELSALLLPSLKKLEKIFANIKKPIIVKPRVGSRGRHTVTHINDLLQFRMGITIARKICSQLIVEEHLYGDVCRATVIGDKLMGFYRGSLPQIVGDGQRTIKQLIDQKNKEKIYKYHIRMDDELHDHIKRLGWGIEDVLTLGLNISLSHRRGQLFGGATSEMIDELHPSFIPIFEKAARVMDVSVVGFDAIIPDPTKDASSQSWGIIECNTLPFIDMHYYALEGKPKNIAGAIWDMWN